MIPNLTPEQLAQFDSFGALEDIDPDLADALDRLDDDFSSVVVPQPAQETPDAVDVVKAKLSVFQNAPSDQDIAAWVSRYGTEGVFAVALAPEDIYIMRFINASEHRLIVRKGTALRQGIDPSDVQKLEALEEQLKFLVAKTCMLWYPGSPKDLTPDYFETARAGLLNNLVTVVNVNSYFFNDPHQILAYTTVLH
jgi:hypothetical protein